MDRSELITLPKAELHVHLEAAIRPGLAAELAKRSDAPLPPSGPFADQRQFVAAYEAARDLVGSLDDLHEVARAFGAHQRACGVVWSEVHFVPPTYGGRLGPDDALIEAVIDGLAAGGGPDRAALIIGINRGLGLEAAHRSLDLAARWAGHGVVALGFAGDEAAYPIDPFMPIFERARAAGLPCVPHAGEIPYASAVAAAAGIGPRICHGVAAGGDQRLVRLLAESQVCLDMAPSSNVLLGLTGSLAAHPLPQLLAEGVPVTLNTDIPLFLGHDLIDEYARCQQAWSLSDDDVRTLAAHSITYAFTPRTPLPGRMQVGTLVPDGRDPPPDLGPSVPFARSKRAVLDQIWRIR